jgi:hypothetical protein
MPAPAKPSADLPPPFRPLRVYAFDPSLATQLDTAVLNQTTLQVLWEAKPGTSASTLQPGPVGEYLEVVDYDPASQCFYAPVDLDAPSLLAQGGLPPSEGNPQFHQQMVYAVAMTTIRHFERALGRLALWSPRKVVGGKSVNYQYVPRLRIYPHALREANAYYSPEKKALLFGYFPASGAHPDHILPGGVVFTCLSHDVVAHETTHALLDGLHRRFNEPTNADVLAFHEGFADLVALLQHFNNQDVLVHQLAHTRGDLSSENLLGQLAQQFGEAIGQYGALRDAIGRVDPATGLWHRLPPNPTALETVTEPHARGALLVAAVFDAFLAIYRTRVLDLFRIATGGSGVLPPGDLHPDLVRRLAGEAAKAAGHVLQMCIRALDYCPPVDLTFGEYLRALITADYDLVPDDDLGYRVAFIESFRRRGIYPRDVRTLSIESLRWQPEFPDLSDAQRAAVNEALGKLNGHWNLTADRAAVYESNNRNGAILHEWLLGQALDEGFTRALGLALGRDAPATIARDPKGRPLVEVHSVRPARRVGPDGQLLVDLVIEITQRRLGYVEAGQQASTDKSKTPIDRRVFDGPLPEGTFLFRGGCTLLISQATGSVRACIKKDVLSPTRLQRQRDFLSDPADQSLRATYFGDPHRSAFKEPFRMLHSDY